MSYEFRVDDLLNINVPSDAQISPAGDRVAYVVSKNGAAKGVRSPDSRVWLVDAADKTPRQITFGPGSDRAPKWSPAGQRLAFLSDRLERGKAQVYLLYDSPGEATKLTCLKSGVADYAWAPDGSRIVVTSMDHAPDTENDVKFFDAERRFQRLYVVDAGSGEVFPVDHGDLHIWEFCFSPDGRSIAAIVSDAPYQWAWYQARLVRIDLDTGEVATLYTPERQIARPVWSPDGTRIALTTCTWSDPGMSGGDLIVIDASTGEMWNLTSGETRSHLAANWLPGSDGLVSITWDRGRAQVCEVGLDGGSRARWTDECSFGDYSFSFSAASGKVSTVLSSGYQTGRVWMIDPNEDEPATLTRPLSEPGTDAPPVPPLESTWLRWESVDGREIEGVYVYPDPERAGVGAPPLVVLIHGGPTAVASVGYRVTGAQAWIPFLRQLGIAVFQPNFRGSNGYGVEFAEANLGDLGGLDLQDVLTGVDECVRQGLADGNRLAIGGWSYGGYIAAWAITQTNRFSAAVAGASITNWFSFHGSSSISGFATQFVGTDPADLGGDYARISPLFQSDRVVTPTLFLHGEQDPVCPVGQAYEMTRALRQHGARAECVVYPREPHGIGERAHRKDMIERVVGWFATHLGVT